VKPLYTQQTTLKKEYIKNKIDLFLKEDRAENDLSTAFTIKNKKKVFAELVAEESLVFVGKKIIDYIFRNSNIIFYKKEGGSCKKGDTICQIEAPAPEILSNERIMLNLIQRLSGIASLTFEYMKQVKGSNIKILDTRKTTPGLRVFEKYAVSVGGGFNHRLDLFDGVMLKDNHLAIKNDISNSLLKFKKKYPTKKVQLEIDFFQQLETIYSPNQKHIDAILLDNMDRLETIKCSNYIKKQNKKCFIESSGGINLKNIKNYIGTGVHGVSIGALTHQATSKNIKLEIK
jgi:nicotinate-nucleotide pyrophosphorylase (carboxylating)